MDLIRVWKEMDIKDIQDHIVMADDRFGHCPYCKKIGLELKDLKSCPSCEREFKYITSSDSSKGKIDMVKRIQTKAPHLTFVDFNDYDRLTGKKKAEDLFNL